MKKLLALLMAFSVTAAFAGCGNNQTAISENPLEDSEILEEEQNVLNFKPEKLQTTAFSKGEMYEFDEEAAVPAYEVENGLSNIVNLNQFKYGTDKQGDYYFAFELDENAEKFLEENGFVVLDNSGYGGSQYYGRYERNRYNYIPSFITTDSALHTFHLLYDYVLKDVERKSLLESLLNLTVNMEKASFEALEKLRGTDWENAAKRNVAYFNVAARLLDDNFSVRDEVRDIVMSELKLINGHEGVAASPIINMGQEFSSPEDAYMVDYTQFIERGHYTQSEELKAYFRASMWYGQMTMRTKSPDEVKSAILMTVSLCEGENITRWKNIFDTVNFFVGECDDITPLDYMEALSLLYGEDAPFEDLLDEPKFEEVYEEIKRMPPPRVNSIPIFDDEIVEDRDEAVTGFRFLGQRFTIDADIMQRLMDRSTKDRMLPVSLDIPAVFGSDEALGILEEDYEAFAYEGYEENMEQARDFISSLDDETWVSNLYYSWLNSLRPLTEEKEEGLPLFMQNDAWERKDLNTFLGSYTELKHDTLLYGKQPMAEMGGGGEENVPAAPDDRGYVEPQPEIFGRLANLAKQTREGLLNAELLTEEAGEVLELYYDIASTLRDLAVKEIRNEQLTEEEYSLIRLYGGQLEHIWDVAKEDEMMAAGYPGKESFQAEHPDAVISDIATDPNGSCLEEATGYAKNIVVAFPRDGEVALGVGTVFSHYEFTVPMEERMTDEKWHEKLRMGEVPPVDNWKKSFTYVE